MPVQVNLAAFGSIVGAVIGVAVLTPVVIRLARRLDWLAYPKEDRWHSKPTALMGGIAIFAAATLAALAFARSPGLWPIWAGATVMFATGLVDDLKHIRPVTKLLAQIFAAGLLIYSGYVFGPGWPIWLSVPVTFLWMIGITNALNLLDNMDGLTAGIAAIAAAILALFSYGSGDVASALIALAVAGAAAGFLIYNFKPARVFMGDSGSLFLGYAIAALSMKIQAEAVNPDGFGVYMVSLAVLAVPIFDTTLVTVMRTATGRAVSQGGRDHSSHRLVFAGLTERKAVLTLYATSALFGLLALLFLFAETRLFYVVAVYMMLGLVIFGIYLARMNVYQEHAAPRRHAGNDRIVAFLHMFAGRNWKFVFGVLADLILIASGFVLAFELRFEDGMTPQREAFVARALPAVIGVKLLAFYIFGLYSAIWRYAGTPELVRIVKATIAGSVFSFVVLGFVFGFGSLSRGVFAIDWMIVTLSVTGIRLGFRGMRQYFAAQRSVGRRVLLYGAGTLGQLSLRELRQNESLGMIAVGFLDDDPLKKGLLVQDLPVLGDASRLAQACLEEKIGEVIITASSMPEERRLHVAGLCQEAAIACSIFRIGFDRVNPADVKGDVDATTAEILEVSNA